MALDYDIEVDGELLIVTTRGFDDDVDEAVAYGESIISSCVENKCNKILVDESEMTTVLDTIGQYEMAQRLISLVPYQFSFAMVVNPANYQETSFGTTVAANRGIHIETFKSRKLACEWLQHQGSE